MIDQDAKGYSTSGCGFLFGVDMVSIIVPYKDTAAWIERCANSLKVQEGDCEFIFVNDHSADNGAELLEAIADGRFILLDNEHADGVSGARNTGIDHAKGEWIAFLDADDELLPKASIIFGHMIGLDDTANIIQANHVGQFGMNAHQNNAGIYSASHLPRSWCMVWNKLYRHSFLDDNDIRFADGVQYGEDELFNLECLTHDNRIFHTRYNTCTIKHYQDNKQSLSHIKGRKELLQQSRVLEDFLENCDNVEIRHAICNMLADRWAHRLMGVFG